MKVSNPLNFRAPRAHSQRNAFDMSYHSYFTSPAGLILPNYVQDVQPGDYLKLDVSNFSRTMPVQTAAFCRMSENTDFYFVPYRLLWRWFDEFYVSIVQQQSALSPANISGSSVPNMLPSIVGSTFADLFSNYGDNVDIFGYKYGDFYVRLFDLLGYFSDKSKSTYSSLGTFLATIGGFADSKFNPFRLLAYQRLWNDFYRNSDWTKPDVMSFNIDNLGSGGDISDDLLEPICKPRYKQWSKDYFTSVKPSTIYDAGSSINNFLGSKPFFAQSSRAGTASATSSFVDVPVTGTGENSIAAIDADSMRNMFAYDKLGRISMLAPKTYKAQLEAHFGVQPDNCNYCSCKYLGSFNSDLNIGEITATSSGTDGSNTSVLGEIAGKGISSSSLNRPISAEFNEPGIVMGMHYFIPQAEYDSQRIDEFNVKLLRSDYYQQEFDSLGLQPLYGRNIQMDTLNLNRSQGWQSRYMEYKTRIDEVHGEFQSKRSLAKWAIPRDVVLAQLGSSNDLYINPSVVNSIFGVNFNGSSITDEFLCHYSYNATLVRNMSVNGIPSL